VVPFENASRLRGVFSKLVQKMVLLRCMIAATPIRFFILAILFLAAHYAALRLHLYWYTEWFDAIMHTWGGFLVVYGFLMLGRVGSGRLAMPRVLLPLALVVVMVVWEVFEYSFGLVGTEANYVRDTIYDLLCGAGGGLLAYVVAHRGV